MVMNELDLLEVFYDEMKAQGVDRTNVYLSLDEEMMPTIQQKFNKNISLEQVHILADICIANEWLERTTADPHYNFLSLTEAGLQVVLQHIYKRQI
jgi:hypothetical protein